MQNIFSNAKYICVFPEPGRYFTEDPAGKSTNTGGLVSEYHVSAVPSTPQIKHVRNNFHRGMCDQAITFRVMCDQTITLIESCATKQ